VARKVNVGSVALRQYQTNAHSGPPPAEPERWFRAAQARPDQRSRPSEPARKRERPFRRARAARNQRSPSPQP